MEPMLHTVAHYIALVTESIAILVIAVGVVDAVVGTLRAGLSAGEDELQGRQRVWMRFARWLVAGMTFQLAADVVSTSFNPSWDELGHLATIAGIRTFLSYFLDREMEAGAGRPYADAPPEPAAVERWGRPRRAHPP